MSTRKRRWRCRRRRRRRSRRKKAEMMKEKEAETIMPRPSKQPADHSWQSGGVDFDDDDNGDTTTNHDDDDQDGNPSVLATLGTKATGRHGE